MKLSDKGFTGVELLVVLLMLLILVPAIVFLQMFILKWGLGLFDVNISYLQSFGAICVLSMIGGYFKSARRSS